MRIGSSRTALEAARPERALHTLAGPTRVIEVAELKVIFASWLAVHAE
jgi:hypothetical protein